MDKRDYAVELKHNGHNCCQAVLCAFAEEMDVSIDFLKQMAAAIHKAFAEKCGASNFFCVPGQSDFSS